MVSPKYAVMHVREGRLGNDAVDEQRPQGLSCKCRISHRVEEGIARRCAANMIIVAVTLATMDTFADAPVSFRIVYSLDATERLLPLF